MEKMQAARRRGGRCEGQASLHPLRRAWVWPRADRGAARGRLSYQAPFSAYGQPSCGIPFARGMLFAMLSTAPMPATSPTEARRPAASTGRVSTSRSEARCRRPLPPTRSNDHPASTSRRPVFSPASLSTSMAVACCRAERSRLIDVTVLHHAGRHFDREWAQDVALAGARPRGSRNRAAPRAADRRQSTSLIQTGLGHNRQPHGDPRRSGSHQARPRSGSNQRLACRYNRSTIVTFAMPPPSHMVCSP